MKIHCLYDALVNKKTLKPHPKNRNKHPTEQIERLAKILEYQGWRYPIKISKRSGFITSGHGRLEAAKLNKWDEVPVNYQDYESDEQEYADVQADNAIASWAELDLSGINTDIGDLGPDFDIDLLGLKDFTIEPADKFQGDEDAVPESRKTDIKLGDLIVLGEHRLLCGDCTVKENVDRLMNGEKADMVFTDPPYGVNYDGGTTKRQKLAGDHNTDLYIPTCSMAFEFSKSEASLYLWHAGVKGIKAAAAAAAAAAGWEIRAEIIWNKNMAQFGALSAQYKQKHEPAYYCFKHGKTVNWNGPTNEVTVWDCKRSSVNEFHPTQKPVELAERAIKNHSVKVILDLFLGSGSTLIACEKTHRKCYGMEIDPSYCQVIVDRWEKFTGRKAVLQ